jgi:hypothetical protein
VKFIVEVPVALTAKLIIEAPSASEARDRARLYAIFGPNNGEPRAAMRELLAHPPASERVEIIGAVSVHVNLAAADVPACDQTCVHCGESNLKSQWGAGLMFCPSCGKTPPAACEAR